jgi:hypothetical protein
MILCSCYGVNYTEYQKFLESPEEYQDSELELVATCCGSCEEEVIRLKAERR